MTCIVNPAIFTSKAALASSLAQPGGLTITDPSIFPGSRGVFNSRELQPGESVVVTNHPKRTRFATIERLANGGWMVK